MPQLIFSANQSHLPRRPALIKRGASRSSRTLGAGCDGRYGTQDEVRRSGRRSRVVLTPRRWRQVGDDGLQRTCDDASHHTGDDASHRTGDGGNKARSPGRARRKPLKPLRRECRREAVHLWRLHSCAFYFAHGVMGATAHPAFPAPSLEVALRPRCLRERSMDQLGRTSAAGMRRCV